MPILHPAPALAHLGPVAVSRAWLRAAAREVASFEIHTAAPGELHAGASLVAVLHDGRRVSDLAIAERASVMPWLRSVPAWAGLPYVTIAPSGATLPAFSGTI